MNVVQTIGLFAAVGGVLAGCGGSESNPMDAGNDGNVSDATHDGTADAPMDASTTSRIDDVVDGLNNASNDNDRRAVLHDVAMHEGWPLEEAGRVLFATEWGDAPSVVAFVSDVNTWSTSRDIATRVHDSSFYYVVLTESSFDAPVVGAKFKWWGAPDIYRAPPEATAYGYDENGEFGWVRPRTDQAHLERFPAFASAHLTDPRTVRAWLPAGFVPRSAEATHMRTLLLHDGQNLFDPNAAYGGWQADVALGAGYGDVVAIAIDNAADRFDAYTHTTDVVGGGTVGGHANDYLDMIETEVLPFARERYGIVAMGDSLMIAGSSLGGLVSIYAAMIHPSVYGCAAGLSSTLGWGSMDGNVSGSTLIEMWPSHQSSAIYLDSGGGLDSECTDADGDGVEDDSPDADNYCVTLQLRDRLTELGYAPHVDVFHAFDPGGGHNEAAWRSRFPNALASCTTGGWTAP